MYLIYSKHEMDALNSLSYETIKLLMLPYQFSKFEISFINILTHVP